MGANNGDYSDLFVSVDKESHIFQARVAPPRAAPQMEAVTSPRTAAARDEPGR